jgi:hypothetical protein
VPKTQAKERTDEREEDGAGGDGARSGDDGGAREPLTLEQVEEVAEDVATRVLEKFIGADDDAGRDGDDGDRGAGDDRGRAGSPRQLERDVAAEVRAEIAKMKRDDEELDQRIGAKVAEKIVERAPVKLSRLARFMWGGDE